MLTNVNGVWRDGKPMTCVNGVWRKSKEWTNVNGVWRTNGDQPIISAETIDSFEMIYTRIRDIRYLYFPHLVDNRNIPCTARVAGVIPVDEYSTIPRSFVFEYSNDKPEEEGLAVYQGILYANLLNGTMISVSEILDNNMDNSNISITIDGSSTYESYGPDVIGWNRVFSNVDNLPARFNDDKNTIIINSYPILPAHNRSTSYTFRSLIGIAREMTDMHINMVGSHGTLDHTIESIKVNNIPMSFRITIYE